MKNLSLSSHLPLAVSSADGTLEPIITAVERYVAMALSPNTSRAYRADWAHFEAWCKEKSLRSFPADPTTIGLYMAALAATSKVSTVERRLTAISKQHRAAGRYSPCSMRYSAICEVLNSIRTEKGTRPNAKAALTTDEIRAMILALPQTPSGQNTRAM